MAIFFRTVSGLISTALEALPFDSPLPVQPERLNPRQRRTPILWKKRHLVLQNGWPYDPATWGAVNI
jgi:hypothetical protein